MLEGEKKVVVILGSNQVGKKQVSKSISHRGEGGQPYIMIPDSNPVKGKSSHLKSHPLTFLIKRITAGKSMLQALRKIEVLHAVIFCVSAADNLRI